MKGIFYSYLATGKLNIFVGPGLWLMMAIFFFFAPSGGRVALVILMVSMIPAGIIIENSLIMGDWRRYLAVFPVKTSAIAFSRYLFAGAFILLSGVLSGAWVAAFGWFEYLGIVAFAVGAWFIICGIVIPITLVQDGLLRGVKGAIIGATAGAVVSHLIFTLGLWWVSVLAGVLVFVVSYLVSVKILRRQQNGITG